MLDQELAAIVGIKRDGHQSVAITQALNRHFDPGVAGQASASGRCRHVSQRRRGTCQGRKDNGPNTECCDV